MENQLYYSTHTWINYVRFFFREHTKYRRRAQHNLQETQPGCENAYMEHGSMWTHFLKNSVCDLKTCFKNRNTKWFPRWSQICALDMSFVTKKSFILSRQKSEILQGYIAVYMWRILSFLDSEIKKWFLRENFLRTHKTCVRTRIFLFQNFLTFRKCIFN